MTPPKHPPTTSLKHLSRKEGEMANLPLDEIADRIVAAVLNEPFINKDSIKPVILSCLRVWIKQTDKPDYSNIKSDKATLLRTAEKRGEERDFHKFRLKKCLSESELNEHYKNLDEYLKSQGY